jgi:hypothetical protein
MNDDNVLSADGERALGMALVRRAYPGDAHFRTAVQGQPSPEDVVSLLDAATLNGAAGICLAPAEAARLLQRMAVQPWSVEPGSVRGQGAGYDVVVALGGARRTVHVQRFPQPHVRRVS